MQKFRKVPDAQITTTAGLTILIPCEVDNQTGYVQWRKDGSWLFGPQRNRSPRFERVFIVGDASRGDHSIELRAARPEDSGFYDCQLIPASDELAEQYFQAGAQVSVKAQQPEPASNLSAPTLKPPKWSADGSATLTRLPDSASQQGSPASSILSAFVSAHGQSSGGSIGSLLAGQSAGFGNQLALSWPYLLLLLAGLLMVANIYLIYSLFKRRTRSSKLSGQSADSHDGSLESNSQGDSSATNSTANTNIQLANCLLEECIQVADTGSAFTISPICIAEAQRLWNGHRLVASNPNGWVLEI